MPSFRSSAVLMFQSGRPALVRALVLPETRRRLSFLLQVPFSSSLSSMSFTGRRATLKGRDFLAFLAEAAETFLSASRKANGVAEDILFLLLKNFTCPSFCYERLYRVSPLMNTILL